MFIETLHRALREERGDNLTMTVVAPRVHADDAARAKAAEVIELVGAVDGILKQQSESDVRYFIENSSRSFSDEDIDHIREEVLRAYRWQYIFSGIEHPRFHELFSRLTTEKQQERIACALAPLAKVS